LKYHYKKKKIYFQEKLKNSNWDVIHSHETMNLFDFMGCSTFPKILTIHSRGSLANEIKYNNPENILDSEIKEKFDDIEMNSINNANIITFPSKASYKLFINSFSKNVFEDKQVEIVYNGVDLNYIKSIEKDSTIFRKFKIDGENEFKLLNIAEHNSSKRVDLIIETMDIFVNKFHRKPLLICIGKGNQTENLRIKTNKLGLEKSIIFIPSVTNQEAINFMKLCDCYISVSDFVVFDMVILEALASGMAVFAGDNGGNKEVIVNGENGILLNNLSPQNIANNLLNYNPKIKNEAPTSVKKFSKEIMVNNYEKLYLSLMKN
jgi:glycosyltransferase involved in cell wall biosynthesis